MGALEIVDMDRFNKVVHWFGPFHENVTYVDEVFQICYSKHYH